MSQETRNNTGKLSIYTTWPLLISLMLLILNDTLLKQIHPGWITGKLSDFSGIFLLILFLRAIFPKSTGRISLAVTLGFTFWKSGFSQPLIDAFNQCCQIKIGRVIDYTDLIALIMVPIAHLTFDNCRKFQVQFDILKLLRIPAILLTLFALTGTSVRYPYHHYAIRKITVDEQVERGKIISVLNHVFAHYELSCVNCDPRDECGEFGKEKIRIRYCFLENNRGIDFEVLGTAGGIFGAGMFKKSSWEEMDRIKSRLKSDLGYAFRDMELVISLPEEFYSNARYPDWAVNSYIQHPD